MRYGDGSNGALNVTSGTTNLLLDTKYQYTTVNVSAGAILSTNSTSGSVLYICATESINIDGLIDVSGKVGRGQQSWSTTIDGITYSSPGVSNGGAATQGGAQGNGYGGGGKGGVVNSTNNTTGANGGTGGTPGGSGGSGGSGTTSSNGSSNGWSGKNGGTSAGGGGGANTSKASSGDPNASATAGSGGSAYGNNGGNGSVGSLGSYNRISAAGGGGAGGNAGRAGVHVVLRAPSVTINGEVITRGIRGEDGGNGGNGSAAWGGSTSQGGYYANGGHGGGGGGSGYSGNVYIFADIMDTASAKLSFDSQYVGVGGGGGSGSQANSQAGTNGNNGDVAWQSGKLIADVDGVYPNGYQHRKALTVDSTKVGSGGVSNFKVLTSFTDAHLKSVANGGLVKLNPLIDIRFELADGTKLFHELVKYDPTTGQIRAWVAVPTLSSASDTTFYIYFGKDLEPRKYFGIDMGVGSFTRFNLKANWYSGGTNPGEVMVNASGIKDAAGNTLTITDGTYVTLAEDGSSYVGNDPRFPRQVGISGFIMYSATAVNSRFGITTTGDATNLIGVFRYNNNWYYDDNGSFATFTPTTGDILVAYAIWNTAPSGDRSVDYLQPLVAGETETTYTWADDNQSPIMYSDYSFGSAPHELRRVYHFDDRGITASGGNFDIEESTVFSNVGASNGSPTYVSSPVGEGIQFDGVNDYIWMEERSFESFQSVWGWVNSSNLSPNQCILGHRANTSDTNGYQWFLLSGALNIDHGTDRWTTTWTPSANTWYHVAVTNDGTTERLYINGTQHSTRSRGAPAGATGNFVTFGSSNSSGTPGNFFPGRIDEFRFVAGTRSAAWIQTVYNNESSPSTFMSVGNLQSKVYVNQTLHAHTVDAIGVMAQNTNLVVNDTLHAHTVDSVTLIQDYKMTVAETLHGHTADHIELQVPYPVPEDTLHTVTSDVLSLVEHKTIVVNDTTHSHTVDNIALDVRLVVESTIHQHTADETGITQEGQLGVQKSFHDVTSTNVVLFQSNRLKVQDASHTHTVDNIKLVEHFQITSVADSYHGHTADGDLIIPIDYQLGVNATSHSLVSDNIAHLHEKYVVQVQEALHAHTADTLTISTGTSLENLEETRHVVTSDNIVLTQKHGLGIANAIHKVISGVVVRIIDWTKLQVFKGKYKNNGVDEGDFIAVIPEEGAKYKAGYRNSGELEVTQGETGAYKVGSSKNGNYF